MEHHELFFPHLLDQSSIFEAFQFVFGMENGVVNEGDVTLTIHRHDQQIVEAIHFNHTRVNGANQNVPQSTYTILVNNNNEVSLVVQTPHEAFYSLKPISFLNINQLVIFLCMHFGQIIGCRR